MHSFLSSLIIFVVTRYAVDGNLETTAWLTRHTFRWQFVEHISIHFHYITITYLCTLDLRSSRINTWRNHHRKSLYWLLTKPAGLRVSQSTDLTPWILSLSQCWPILLGFSSLWTQMIRFGSLYSPDRVDRSAPVLTWRRRKTCLRVTSGIWRLIRCSKWSNVGSQLLGLLLDLLLLAVLRFLSLVISWLPPKMLNFWILMLGLCLFLPNLSFSLVISAVIMYLGGSVYAFTIWWTIHMIKFLEFVG